MAVTIEGVFVLVDRASSALRRIELQARKTDSALRGAGKSMDTMTQSKTIRNMERMDRQMQNLERDSGGLEKQFNRTEKAGGLLNDRLVTLGARLAAIARIMALLKWPVLIAGAGLAAQGIGALAGAVVGLLPPLADLSALGAALPATLLGIGGAAFTAQFALKGVSEALGGNKEAMKELTPQAREFVRELKGLQPVVDRLRGAAQRGMFPGLTRGVQQLAQRGAPTAQRLMGRFGREVGGAAEQAAGRLTRPGTLADIDVLGRQGARIFNRMVRGALNLADAIRNIAIAARPFTEWLSNTLLTWTRLIRETTRHGRETGKLRDFFERARKTLEQLFRIAGNLWNTFRGILRAARPLSEFILDFFEGATEKWESFTNSQRGQARMRRWFNAIRPPLKEFFGLIGDIFKVWVDLTERGGGRRGALTRSLRGLRDIARPLGKLLGDAAEALGPSFIDALGEFVELMGNLPWRPMEKVFQFLSWSLDKVNKLIEKVPILGEVLSVLVAGGAIAKLMGGGGGGGGALGGGLLERLTSLGGGLLQRRGGKVGKVGGALSRATAVPVWVVNMGAGGLGVPGPGGGGGGGGGWRSRVGRFAKTWGRALRIGGPVAAAGGLAWLYSEVNKDLPTGAGSAGGGRAAPTVRAHRGRPDPTVTPREAFTRVPDMPPGSGVRPTPSQSGFGGWIDIAKKYSATRMKDESAAATAVSRAHRREGRSHEKLREQQDKTKKNVRETTDDMTERTRRATERSENRLEELRKAFNRKTADMKQVTNRGFSKIEQDMLRYLSRIQGKNAPGTTGLTPGPSGQLRPGAKGVRVPGHGLRDTVPVAPGAIAAPGELIVNRHTERDHDRDAQQAGLPSLAQRVREEKRPHSAPLDRAMHGRYARRHAYGGRVVAFQRGGIVPIPGQPGESIHSSIVNQVVRLANRYRLTITDGYAPTGHAASGEHPLGLAIDAVPGPGGSWDLVDALAHWAEPSPNQPRAPFRWVGYDGDANHGRGNHLHLSWSHSGGQLGAMGSLAGLGPTPRIKMPRAYDGGRGLRGQTSRAALRRVRRRAQRRINREFGSAAGAGDLGAGVSGSNQQMGLQMMMRMGFPRSQWPALKELWTRESGWSHTVSNPSSGAHGIPQSLPASKMASEGADYMSNPKTQIAWGLKYIKGRYGTPSAALAFHDSHNWYGQGGRIPWFAAGGDFVARRPMVIGVGDRPGGERVRVGPAGGGGARQGPLIGQMHIVNRQPGDVRNQVVREVRQALKSVRRELEEAGVEDGDLA